MQRSLRQNHIVTWLLSWRQLGPSSFGITNDSGTVGALLRRLHLSNRPDGVKQVKVKSLAYGTRLGIFVLSLSLWLESCAPQWGCTLVDRLCHFAYQCKAMGQRTKALVLRLCGLRSSPASIIASLELKMDTIEKPEGKMEVCDWCRMAIHTKCVMKTRVTGVCICQCERGVLMIVYVVHAIETHDSDTGHDEYYQSHVYQVFKTKRKAEEFSDREGGHVTKMTVRS